MNSVAIKVVRGNPWLVNVNPQPNAPWRLVMFPHAGAGASAYYCWADEFAAHANVFIVQLPGRESRAHESLIRNVTQASSGIAQAIGTLDSRPTVFFGHSLGALLAYEVCRRMMRCGMRPPKVIFVAGRSPPHVKLPRQSIFSLPSAEFLHTIAQLGGLSPEVLNATELLDYLEPILRADMEMNDTFKPEPAVALDISLVALSGRDDQHFPPDDIERWRDTAKECSIHYFDGGHFFINHHRKAIVELVKRHLDLKICQRAQTC